MPKIDDFERFRDETLTEQEQDILNAARGPEAKVEAHKEIAQGRAWFQLRDKPMPEGVESSIRCPGVDPMGKYSVIDMRFAKRMDAVESALSVRNEEVQKRVRAVLQACTTRNTANPLYVAYSDMQTAAEQHRIFTRASKLCLDPTGREELAQQARELEVDPRVVRFDKLMQGIEYLSGVRLGEVPQEITEFFNTELGIPLSQELAEEGRQVSQQLPQVAVEFKNIENKALLQTMADPRNWGMTWKEVEKASWDTLNIESGLPAYAAATADRIVTPLFQEAERRTQGMADRSDLISIDGKTVRELAQEQFAASSQAGSFDDFFRQNSVRMTNELVAAGLMAGKRVEAFVPDKYGQVPKEPTQLTKAGYEPSSLKPEHFNAWQRFFSKRGFYKEKVARQAEYDKVMGARDRMRQNAEKGVVRARLSRLQNVLKSGDRYDMARNKGLFFDEIFKEHNCVTVTADGATRYDGGKLDQLMRKQDPEPAEPFLSFGRSEAAAACACYMAAQGHKLQDIMDPNKLQAERHEVARMYMDKLKANDTEWLGQTYYRGCRALMQQFEDVTRGVDLSNENQRLAVLPLARGITGCAFLVNQRIDKSPEACASFYREAMKEHNTDAARTNEVVNDMRFSILSASDAMDIFADEVKALTEIADPTKPVQPAIHAGQLGAAQMLRQTMRDVPLTVKNLPTRTVMNVWGSGFSGPDSPLQAALKDASSPERRTGLAMAAASGQLTDELRITGFHTENALNAKTNQPMPQTDRGMFLKADGDGRFSIERRPIARGYVQNITKIECDLGRALSGPKPELRRDGPKQEGPKQNAPKKQAPQKTAKPGGLAL